jgi:pimeloyl-ACP methyl ester carboxylesterase
MDRPARTFLTALLLLTAACYRMKPATVPLRAITLERGAPDSRCLVVFLPGRGDIPEDYAKHGFPEALRRAGSRCAMVGVDSHLGYYVDRSIVTRLDEDVIAPARAHGVQDVWLVGISLGGLGSLLYTREHPGTVKGLILLSPYLGGETVIREVAQAGGLAAWSPQHQPPEGDFRGLWLFLKRYEKPDPSLPPLWLGYGRSERFAETEGLLAKILPPDHVVTAAGHHNWRTWGTLWKEIVGSGVAPGVTPR